MEAPQKSDARAPRGAGRVRGHRVPNVGWLAPTEAELRAHHPRYVALPPQGSRGDRLARGSDERPQCAPPRSPLELANTRQHTPEWRFARERSLTGSSLAALCGFYERGCGMAKTLGLPKSAENPARMDEARSRLRGARGEVWAWDAEENGSAEADEAASAAAQQAAACNARAALRGRFDDVPADSDTLRLEFESALLAARVGPGEVACNWGHAQEPAALAAALAALPRAAVCEVGLIAVVPRVAASSVGVVAAAEATAAARSVTKGVKSSNRGAKARARVKANARKKAKALAKAKSEAMATPLSQVPAPGDCSVLRGILEGLPRIGASPDGLMCFDARKEAALLRCLRERGGAGEAPAGCPAAAAALRAAIAATPSALPSDYELNAVLPLEVKSRCPFVASTEGLRGGSNMSSYKVCAERAGSVRASVAPYHIPQLQLEALAAGAPGTLVGYHAARGGIELHYLPRDDKFLLMALRLAADTLAAASDDAARGRELATRRAALAQHARRMAHASAQRVANATAAVCAAHCERVISAAAADSGGSAGGCAGGARDRGEPFLRLDSSSLRRLCDDADEVDATLKHVAT